MNLASLTNLIFPPMCVSCGRTGEGGGHLCGSCFGRIALNTTLFCGACRARLPEGRKICHMSSPYLLGAATSYEKEVKAAVQAFKFKCVRSLGTTLGSLLLRYANNVSAIMERAAVGFSAVIPMPLSSKRERERGFNQSGILAEFFAANLRMPYANSLLVKTRHTKAQSETKSLEERRRNISGCFAVRNPGDIEKKIVFLIDDVITSGATVEEAARELKKAGAKEVLALVVAQA